MSNMKRKKYLNKVVVVTGGASGIGAALCRHFGSEGANIAVIDHNKNLLTTFIKELENHDIPAIGIHSDITDEKKCDEGFNTIKKRFGGIDLLINNAGITQRSAFTETDISVYRKVMDVNFFGSLICTKAAIKSIIERKGAIVVTSSIAGLSPLYGRTGYSASKHALHGLFESLRTEVKSHGVHVLMLCPGFTATNLQDSALDGDGTITKHPQSFIGKQDTPQRVAEKLMKALLKKKNLLVLTGPGKAGYFISRIAPGLYERIITNKFKKELDR